MKRSVKSLIGYTMGATDGEIGKVKEFYFDDKTWTIRYLIVETGNWLSGRKVLISPAAALQPDWENKIFPVNLTIEQIKNSPDIDTDMPVSRQEEIKLHEHYPWGNYWGHGLWGGGVGITGMIMPVTVSVEQAAASERNTKVNDSLGDPQLRSTNKVKGYKIHATDAEIGHVEDFIIDDQSWKINFLLIDTGNLLSGKKVLLSPDWIEEIKWETSRVIISASIDEVKKSPEYDPAQPINELYEENMYDYYGMLVKHKK